MRRAPLFFCILLACRKGPTSSTGTPGGPGEAPSNDGAPPTAAAVLSSRCHPTERSVRLDKGTGLADLEIGDAVVYGDLYGVGLMRRTQAGRLSAVALLSGDAKDVRILDLVPALGDAPPPRLAACGHALVAVSLGLAKQQPSTGAESGNLVVSVVDPPQEQPPVLIPQHRDDSLSFDFACSGGAAGLAVWDETVPTRSAGAPSRGVVRAAALDVGHPGVRLRDASPPDSDAEMPRVVAHGAGFFVFWIARRPEAPTGDANAERPFKGPSALEGAGEARTYGWLEMTTLDFDAKPTGPVRRLTPASGHVSTYDVRALGGPTPGVSIIARDDAESAENVGGTLLRVRALLDGAEASSAVRTDGLGRGPPTFVEGPAPWMTWVGAGEQLRLLPLSASDELDAAPSAEGSLEEARPLLSLGGGDSVLVATPRDPLAQLRVFACRR